MSTVDSVFVKTRSLAILRDRPEGAELARIPAKTRLFAMDFDGHYWKVLYGGLVGVLLNVDVSASNEDRVGAQRWAEEPRRSALAAREAERVAVAKQAPLYRDKRDALLRERLWVSAATANVRANPATDAESITKIERDRAVYIQERQADWYRVIFDGPIEVFPEHLVSQYQDVTGYEQAFRYGWVHKSLLSTKTPAERRIQREMEATKARRREYVARHSELTKQQRDAVLAGTIALGLSQEAVRVSIGDPRDINRSVGSWGVHEQWVYSGHFYVYFENGVLTSWQE